MTNALNIESQEEFEAEVEKSDLPVLVDFWAIWCGPCKAIAPRVDYVADQTAGQLKVVKVDVDVPGVRDVAAKYNIRSIPTLLFFKNGEVVERIVGAAISQEELLQTAQRVTA
jgi:thioredoxin 1